MRKGAISGLNVKVLTPYQRARYVAQAGTHPLVMPEKKTSLKHVFKQWKNTLHNTVKATLSFLLNAS